MKGDGHRSPKFHTGGKNGDKDPVQKTAREVNKKVKEIKKDLDQDRKDREQKRRDRGK